MDRIQIIVNNRLPMLARHVQVRTDLQASQVRMASAIREMVASTGGERFWYRDGNENPTLYALFGELSGN